MAEEKRFFVWLIGPAVARNGTLLEPGKVYAAEDFNPEALTAWIETNAAAWAESQGQADREPRPENNKTALKPQKNK